MATAEYNPKEKVSDWKEQRAASDSGWTKSIIDHTSEELLRQLKSVWVRVGSKKVVIINERNKVVN